ncbi:unnamed protein product [Moneuplotes crassus]|uniref:Uncharacterized protein n=1 Tax=Euplotes crassus TaxID=5936 RepID=A0AAD2D5W7_EUPCR|nr:unnamed protein product [Moneuplotes crassus]
MATFRERKDYHFIRRCDHGLIWTKQSLRNYASVVFLLMISAILLQLPRHEKKNSSHALHKGRERSISNVVKEPKVSRMFSSSKDVSNVDKESISKSKGCSPKVKRVHRVDSISKDSYWSKDSEQNDSDEYDSALSTIKDFFPTRRKNSDERRFSGLKSSQRLPSPPSIKNMRRNSIQKAMNIPELNPILIFKKELIKKLREQNPKVNPVTGQDATNAILVRAFKNMGIHLSVVGSMQALLETKPKRIPNLEPSNGRMGFIQLNLTQKKPKAWVDNLIDWCMENDRVNYQVDYILESIIKQKQERNKKILKQRKNDKICNSITPHTDSRNLTETNLNPTRRDSLAEKNKGISQMMSIIQTPQKIIKKGDFSQTIEFKVAAHKSLVDIKNSHQLSKHLRSKIDNYYQKSSKNQRMSKSIEDAKKRLKAKYKQKITHEKHQLKEFYKSNCHHPRSNIAHAENLHNLLRSTRPRSHRRASSKEDQHPYLEGGMPPVKLSKKQMKRIMEIGEESRFGYIKIF